MKKRRKLMDQMSISFYENQDEFLRKESDSREVSMSVIVREALDEYMKKLEGNKE